MENNKFELKLSKAKIKTLTYFQMGVEQNRKWDYKKGVYNGLSARTTEEKINLLWMCYLQELKNQADPTLPDKKAIFEERCRVVKDLETLLGHYPVKNDFNLFWYEEEDMDVRIIDVMLEDLERIKDYWKTSQILVSKISKLFY